MLFSLCMIVKNEAEVISECLKSVRGVADEIIVVDTGSSDDTAAIAESLGAKVYEYKWSDSFADARNYSLSKASGKWILIMDADDILEPDGRKKLIAAVESAPPEADLFCFRILSYTGNKADENNIFISHNIRLIKNGKGYRYKGRVHEQVCIGKNYPEKSKLMYTGINIRHYGYLNSYIRKKEKHKRNIALIKKELSDDPSNAFMLFNMGNELFMLNAPQKALDYYMESYKKFDPEEGFSAELLVRIIACYEKLCRFGEMLRFAKLGIAYYPQITDFEYLKAVALCKCGRTEKAVRSFKKCIKMGSAPLYADGNAGIGTFKPNMAIAEIYRQTGDFKKAILYYHRAVIDSSYMPAAYAKMADIFFCEGVPPETVKKKFLRMAVKDNGSYLMLSDIFYDRGLYKQALALARFASKTAPEDCAAWYDEGVCLFYLRNYSKAYDSLLKAGSGSLQSRSAFFRVLCIIFGFGGKTTQSNQMFFQRKLDSAYYSVMSAYIRLRSAKKCHKLSEDKNVSAQYEKPIFGLFEVLLRSGRQNELPAALQLLDLINDDSVLLLLGKLYYKFGYNALAYRELFRSIKLTGKIDAEGLQIMRDTINTAGL